MSEPLSPSGMDSYDDEECATVNQPRAELLKWPHNPFLPPEVLVKDQDGQPVEVTEVHRGYGAIVAHVDVAKPPTLLSTDDAVIALGAALLGVNLYRGIRVIAVDVENELARMGYALTTKEPKHT